MPLFQGSISLGEPSLQPVSQSTASVTEAKTSVAAASTGTIVALQPKPATESYTVQHERSNPITVINSSPVTTSAIVTTCGPASTVAHSKLPTTSSVNVAPYKKPITTIARRTFAGPFIVRNGHKVQCLMVPPKNYTTGQFGLNPYLAEDTLTHQPPWS